MTVKEWTNVDGTRIIMDMTYRLADAPKLSSQYVQDCTLCGHEELGRPVFLAGPAGVAPYGTGCAAKLLGLPVAELEAVQAIAQLRELAATSPRVADAWSWLSMTLPTRVTAKYVAEMVARIPDAELVATVVAAYKALHKVGRVRELRAAELRP